LLLIQWLSCNAHTKYKIHIQILLESNMVIEIGGKDASYTFNWWILGALRPLEPRKKLP
jgi:hypothetical protein